MTGTERRGPEFGPSCYCWCQVRPVVCTLGCCGCIMHEHEVVHYAPPDGGGGLMPCCQLSPYDVPRYHRITSHKEKVTCRGRK